MEKRFLNVKEIAEYLCVKEDTIRKWIRLRKIPHCKINGLIRFEKVKIDRWLQKNERCLI